MTTQNQVGVALSGKTGTGNFVGSTSATLVTPTLGAATATTITFNPTTGGIVGTTTNDNANAGNVGEYISSTILNASKVTITSSGVAQNLTSISLTAGDWDVFGNVSFSTGGTMTSLLSWTSSTSATRPDQALESLNGTTATTNLNDYTVIPPYARYSLSGTTTIYISAYAAFTVNCSMCGFIAARRVR